MEIEKWVWKRLLLVFLASIVFSFLLDGLSNTARDKCLEFTIFFSIIALIYAALKPEPGEDSVEIDSPGEILVPILLFAGPVMGGISFFLARLIRTLVF